MEAVKKYWFWGIFISILSIFAMSHNAGAIDFTMDLNSYDVKYYAGGTSTTYRYDVGGNNLSSNITCINCIPSGIGFINIRYLEPTLGNLSYNKSDIITFDLIIWTKQNYNINNVVKTINLFPTDQTAFQYMGYDELSNEYATEIYSTYYTNANDQLNGFDISSRQQGFKVLRLFFKVKKDIVTNFSLSSNNFIFQYISIQDEIAFRTANFTIYKFVGTEENREQQEKTQEAVDDSQAAGGSSSQDAQTGTTGLLNAITGAVSVISSASPTNCKLNGNMGNLDIGQLDLCANPAPAFIQTIGSLILILMCVPLAISLFNRFIAIFRSFQS